MRAELRSLPCAGTRPSSITAATRDVEAAWAALVAASDRFGSPRRPGNTEELFRRRDEWVRAMRKYESEKRKLETLILQADGRAWLRAVPGD